MLAHKEVFIIECLYICFIHLLLEYDSRIILDISVQRVITP